MDEIIVQVLFAAAAISAGIAAFGKQLFARVEKVALAVCLAAAAFFVSATELFK